MARSARKDSAGGVVDRAAGWVLGLVGRVTGKPSTRVKGKAAGGRGHLRTQRGRAKSRTGRRH